MFKFPFHARVASAGRTARGTRPVPRACAVPAACCAIATLVLVSAVAVPAGGDVVVNPWGPPAVETFDHTNPPPDLDPSHAADERPEPTWSGGAYNGTWNPTTNTYTVTTLADVTLSGKTRIRLPDDASPGLIEHENGHDRLNGHEWSQNAKKKMEDALRGFVGKEFVGEGATDADRQQNAVNKAKAERDKRINGALAAITAQMDVLGEKFDDLTTNGTSPDVTTADGEAEAKAEQAKAAEAGSAPAEPDESEESSQSDGLGMYYDEASRSLAVSGPGFIYAARQPFDPVIGRGQVVVGEMIHIGMRENGTIRLADTHLHLMDSVTGEALVSGYLLEAAYMPSNVPGHPWMIQGYLDIPPDWAGGISNPIGSPFLAGMQAASEAGQPTTVWMYPMAPLFDGQGNPTIPPEGVPLMVSIGVAAGASPVPSLPGWGVPVLVLLAGAGVAVLARRGRRRTA